MVDYLSNKGVTNVNELEIKSFYGNYNVFFVDDLPLKSFIHEGDIVIIDQVIADAYFDAQSGLLNNKNTIVVEATENNKSYEGIIPIMEKLISTGFHKNNTLVAVGGGVIQDIVAFIASILYRGVWKTIWGR